MGFWQIDDRKHYQWEKDCTLNPGISVSGINVYYKNNNSGNKPNVL